MKKVFIENSLLGFMISELVSFIPINLYPTYPIRIGTPSQRLTQPFGRFIGLRRKSTYQKALFYPQYFCKRQIVFQNNQFHKSSMKSVTQSYTKNLASTGGSFFGPASTEEKVHPSATSNTTQWELEDDILERLKSQQKKIEQLTELYADSEEKCGREMDKNRALLEEIEKLNEFVKYKPQYEELQRAYEDLYKTNEEHYSEVKDLKQLLGAEQNEAEDIIAKMKLDIKLWKEKHYYLQQTYDKDISGKQSEIQRLSRSYEQVKYKLETEVKSLEDIIHELKQAVLEKDIQFEDEKKLGQEELRIKENELHACDKALQKAKKQITALKLQCENLENEIKIREEDYEELVEQSRIHLKNCKKDAKEKELYIYELRDALKRNKDREETLESTISSLRSNMKKLKENSETSVKKVALRLDEDKTRTDAFVNEMRCEMEDLINNRSSLISENKHLRSILEKKEELERHRRHFLESECKQIGKLEKIVDWMK